jgi:hypothetical protein
MAATSAADDEAVDGAEDVADDDGSALDACDGGCAEG